MACLTALSLFLNPPLYFVLLCIFFLNYLIIYLFCQNTIRQQYLRQTAAHGSSFSFYANNHTSHCTSKNEFINIYCHCVCVFVRVELTSTVKTCGSEAITLLGQLKEQDTVGTVDSTGLKAALEGVLATAEVRLLCKPQRWPPIVLKSN